MIYTGILTNRYLVVFKSRKRKLAVQLSVQHTSELWVRLLRNKWKKTTPVYKCIKKADGQTKNSIIIIDYLYPRPRRDRRGYCFAVGLSVSLFVCLFVCVCVSVCLSVREHISKTNDQIYLIFSQNVWSVNGSVFLEDDPDRNLDPDFMTDFMTIFGVREHI